MELTARQQHRRGKHSCTHNSTRNTPRSFPSPWPRQAEEFPPGMSHFPRHPCSFWNGAAEWICSGCLLAVQPQRSWINAPEAWEHHSGSSEDGPLCLSTPERVLKWGFSLSSPSTAPAQHFPSFLADKTNTFAIYSEFQPPLNPRAGFGQYQPRSQSWSKNKQQKKIIG